MRYQPLANMRTAEAVAHVTPRNETEANDPDRLATIGAELLRLDAMINELHARRSEIHHSYTAWREAGK